MIRILIADDHELMRSGLRAMLEFIPYSQVRSLAGARNAPSPS